MLWEGSAFPRGAGPRAPGEIPVVGREAGVSEKQIYDGRRTSAWGGEAGPLKDAG